MKIDYKSPDYVSIFNQRIKALDRIRAEPQSLPALKPIIEITQRSSSRIGRARSTRAMWKSVAQLLFRLCYSRDR